MGAGGTNLNSQAFQGMQLPQVEERFAPETQKPVEQPKTEQPTKQAKVTREQDSKKDAFERHQDTQQVTTKTQVKEAQQQKSKKADNPEQARKLAENISKSTLGAKVGSKKSQDAVKRAKAIAAKNAALTTKPKDGQTSADIDETNIPQEVQDALVDPETAKRAIRKALAKGDQKTASDIIHLATERAFKEGNPQLAISFIKFAQTLEKEGTTSLSTPDLLRDGQMSAQYGRGLITEEHYEDFANALAATPGAGSASDAKFAAFLRNGDADGVKKAPPKPDYDLKPKQGSIQEAISYVSTLVAPTPWDSLLAA